MTLILPKFDVGGMPELQSPLQNDKCEWGWIGSVSLENKEALDVFFRAAEKGDIASMKLFQDLASNVVFAIARICGSKADIVLLQKTEEPALPNVIDVWGLENAKIVIGPSVPHDVDARLTKATHLSWKEICAAIARSFK